MRVFLGLGSNVGDRVAHLQRAVATLDATGDLVAVSPVYETEPVGGPDQDRFLNLVVELDTAETPPELLKLCHRLEREARRARTVHWGPRTLDVDVLWVEGTFVADRNLQIPHPRMWERRFVLAPLRDLAPDLVSDDAVDGAEGAVEPVGDLHALPTRG